MKAHTELQQRVPCRMPCSISNTHHTVCNELCCMHCILCNCM